MSKQCPLTVSIVGIPCQEVILRKVRALRDVELKSIYATAKVDGNTYIYIYIYRERDMSKPNMYVCMCMYIYIYIMYREREIYRERYRYRYAYNLNGIKANQHKSHIIQ